VAAIVNGKLVWLVPPPPLPVPPCGAGGLKTLTFAAPTLAISVLLTVACICVALVVPTVVSVVCVPPAPHKTCEPPDGSDVGRKLLPVTVRVNATPPATAQLGDWEDTAGSGLPGGLMMNASEFESPFIPAPEKGLSVWTKAVPGLATSDAGTVAVMPMTLPALSVCNWVAIVPPFHCTTVLATNPPPTTVSVNCGLPAVVLAGESEVMDAPVGTWNVFP
jgi:hypothetical protein